MVRYAGKRKCEKSPEQTLDKVPQPLGWAGGKNRLVNKLIDKVPSHDVYVEPMAGGASLFWAKHPAKKNVLNDVNSDLMSFYENLKNVKNLKCDMSPDAKKFENIKQKKSKGVCDFLYLNKSSMGNRMETFMPMGKRGNGGKKCKDTGNYINCNVKNIADKIDKVSEKANMATLENKDFRNIIKKYDSPNTFIYLDPPYVDANKKSCLYGKNCGVKPNEVVDAVKSIKGKALISYDDHPLVRKAFKDFKIEKVPHTYTLGNRLGGKSTKVNELLIRNYEVQKCKK